MVEIGPELTLGDASPQIAWVAAMSFTSVGCSATAPNRRTRFASMTVRSLLCSVKGSASISSRNSMPPDAASQRPGFARLASVKAPGSKPNSSASSNDSGIAAQFTSTNGPSAAGRSRE